MSATTAGRRDNAFSAILTSESRTSGGRIPVENNGEHSGVKLSLWAAIARTGVEAVTPKTPFQKSVLGRSPRAVKREGPEPEP